MQKTKKKNKKIIFIVIGVVILLVLIFLLLNIRKNKEVIYKVGEDIEPGEYVLVTTGSYTVGKVSDDNYGYYAICSNEDCNAENGDIIANDNVFERAYIILEDNQYLKTKYMKLYKVNDYNANLQSSASRNYNFSWNTYYKIGKDLSAGTYKLTGDNLYYEVCTKPSCKISLDSEENESITNGYGEDNVTVTLENGQYLIIGGKGKANVVKEK